MPNFQLLGPLQVRGLSQPVALGGSRPRALLAQLIIEAGSVLPAEHLVAGLWDDRPPRSAAHLLHVYVSSLRRSFREAGEPIRLLTRAPGYVLELAPADVDASRFEKLLVEGRRLLGDGEPARAAAVLRAALALWQGPALADLVDRPFARAEAMRLEELKVVALESRIEADITLGHAATVVAELEALVDESPLRESLRGQLMLALYRAGRQVEALEVYRAARRRFVDELGVEPGPSLRRLERAILRQDADLELASRS